MIDKISRIKGFGIFADFRWPPGLRGFKRYNLIYGWNYSGKTTLSRVFRCFERGQSHPDFAAGEAEIKLTDGTVRTISAPVNAPALCVFNSDFVQEHLRFDTATASPVLVLGAEDIKKQQTLTTKSAERQTLLSDRDATDKRAQEKETAIQTALTRVARDAIKTALRKPNYDKTKFEPRVKECAASPNRHLLNEKSLEEQLSIFRSTDRKDELAPTKESLTSVARIREKASVLLKRVVAANNPLQRLKDNPELERWVREGQALHAEKDICQFCGQLLPSGLLLQVAGHFSAEYESLMTELGATEQESRDAQNEEIALWHESGLYPEFAAEFAARKEHLAKLLGDRKAALRILAEAMLAKQTKAFTRLECPTVDDSAAEITSDVKALNSLIAEHNRRTAEFEARRDAAFTALELHYAAAFVRDERYNEEIEQIASLKATSVAQGKKLDELDSEIRALEQALSESVKGAEQINGLLVACFGKDDLRIEVSADNQFRISRGNHSAKCLSEGEKTAIAFAYFITRVRDGRQALADMRVVIDDPISSLDANHLFNTYALIKTQLAECRQLFVATHSFEFFNLFREWSKEDKEQKEQWGIFLVRRLGSGTAVLQEIPEELWNFRSEYHYLFSLLYHFAKTGRDDDFGGLLTLPNVARRFMEAFGGIMIPKSEGLRPKMKRLFPDPVARERVWKFVNSYSHNDTSTRSLQVPDMSECVSVVEACLDSVKSWDATYFDELVSEIS